jgi:hypothetical protein
MIGLVASGGKIRSRERKMAGNRCKLQHPSEESSLMLPVLDQRATAMRDSAYLGEKPHFTIIYTIFNLVDIALLTIIWQSVKIGFF